jgi:hypothetical protein
MTLMQGILLIVFAAATVIGYLLINNVSQSSAHAPYVRARTR